MPLHTSTLPPEIWQIILDFLSLRARRTCLLISKLLHDIAAKAVFSSIVLQFGSWCDDPDASEASEERELSRAWDILQYVARNPSFAANIKKVVIFSFLKESAIFDWRFAACLIMALRELNNLRSFTWYNTTPELSSDVVATLVEFCPRLEAIHVPIPHHLRPELFRLNHLRSIYIQLREFSTVNDSSYVITRVDLAEYHALISANTATLREMSFWYTVFWNMTPAILQNLTHLELLLTSELQNIAQLLQENMCLESLTIWPSMRAPPEFEALKLNATAWPRLTSLKLLDIDTFFFDDDDVDGDNPIEAIANFLRGRRNLRRLDLGLRCEFETLLPLFEGFQWRELESLDVLGLALKFDVTVEDARMIECCIPRGLTALSVSGWLDRDICATFLEAVSRIPSHCIIGISSRTMQFPGFPNLNFLYIGDDELYTDNDKLEHPLDCDDVVNTLQRLELFGYNKTVMEVERQGDGTVLATSKWSTRKIRFRSVEDFGCGDWEWLIRHHLISKDLF
ncbi:hypothetical protein B0H21DRAFT_689275 [Amylocystis lapponica]|nr:hypothetical protein B0H21DRAFT_689275 [Amylocystis lapponica]